MALFLRLLKEKDKAAGLSRAADTYRNGDDIVGLFEVEPETFRQVPSVPFAYWVGESVLGTFQRLPPFEGGGRVAKQGLATAEDFRFVRTSWEIPESGLGKRWFGFAKGGTFSPFYSDVHLVVNWAMAGAEIGNLFDPKNGKLLSRPQNIDFFHRPGLTWPRRTSSGLSMRVMPVDCIFADKGPAAFVESDESDELLALLAVTTSKSFQSLVELQLAAADAAARSYEVGVIKRTPVPLFSLSQSSQLAVLARHAWSLKRTIDTVEETSHAFLLPVDLRTRLSDYDSATCKAELTRIHAEIDAIVFDLYGFGKTDFITENTEIIETKPSMNSGPWVVDSHSLFSWSIGITFGRFDWRLATGERKPPSEPEPFDPLPAKSPGMLPDDVEPFYQHAGILVDDPGHPHDIVHLIESVQERVDVPISSDVRRWLQRDFFKEHVKQYSKSRRKAPIYWPLATASSSYTLWIYYPTLNAQTLYTAVNDFVEPKLKSVSQTEQVLRGKATRSKTEERELEQIQDFELELTDLRDTLLQIAKDYAPNHDDGVQITAAPLWSLFRHKPWQNVLKGTWAKLEKGDYDWAHLAMNYWPERVREKCKTDKSLAIAHGLEELYEEPPEQPKKKRGRRKS